VSSYLLLCYFVIMLLTKFLSQLWFVCVLFQEMNAAYIESNLLNQLRLVTVSHVYPVWVYKTCIFIKAGE